MNLLQTLTEKEARFLYDTLIFKARERGLDKTSLEGYFEFHHILPRSLGGTDEKTNLVLLTALEHIRAHRYLIFIYTEQSRESYLKMLGAYWGMLYQPASKGRLSREISEEKAAYKREWKCLNKAAHRGKGKKLSEEHKKHISEALKGKKTWNVGLTAASDSRVNSLSHPCVWKGKKMPDGTGRKISSSMKERYQKDKWISITDGKTYTCIKETDPIPKGWYRGQPPLSPERKELCGKAVRGRIWITDGFSTRMILPSDILPEGWYKGRPANLWHPEKRFQEK